MVTELNSYEIHLHQPLKTNQIMKMYKMMAQNNCDVYLYQNSLIADGGHLTKLLSFFLFVDLDEPILMIIDGENVDCTYNDVQKLCKDNIHTITCRRKYDESMIQESSSIIV
ncbi:hypothetical protein [Halobacillus yeomjeoni]|uniref:hypothetical protein n=1 Tax=Halobacillus yeomjeoni TaxID=311194 RepID=UPI00385024EF